MATADGGLNPSGEKTFLGFQTSDRVELVSTIVLAVAVIFTAWSAFQSAKWGGIQSIRFSEAGAARTESVRLSTLAGQQAQIDATLFVDWITAWHGRRDRPQRCRNEPKAGLVGARYEIRVRGQFSERNATSAG